MKKLAVLGGEPVKTTPFPAWPIYDDRERQVLLEVLESRVWWRTPGTKTKAFEEEFAAYQQARHGIACTNGTAALEMVMAALEIGPGDEVIVPDFTFVATASAVLFAGAMPIMVDILPDTYCIDPDKIEAAITPRTKAVIAVHLGGHPADMERLLEICKKHKIYLIEDSAHAHGSIWKEKKVGAIGDAGTFSFQASKLMTAGEGGIVITNDDDLAVKIRSVHDCGRMPGEWFYDHFIYGSNYRLSEWQGAILSQQLSRLEEQNAKRIENAAYLNEKLNEIDGIQPQAKKDYCTRNGNYCYIFHYDPEAFGNLPAKRFIEALEAEGIPTQASYPPIHQLDLFTSNAFRTKLSSEQATQSFDFLKAEFPVTQDAADNTIWLVHRTLLGEERDVQEIVTAVKKIQDNVGELLP